ncbi:MAG: hypothetical protein R2850_11930, partial [Bacteroidia bacterium]
MNFSKIARLLVALTTISQSVMAQGKNVSNDSTERRLNFKHAINTCPAGLAFGIFSVNYEYLLESKPG